MPVIKSAKKKLRQDKKRTLQNSLIKKAFKTLIKKARISPTEETIRKATQAVDKATKKYIMHKNKAARIKSQLSKLLTPKKTSPTKKEAEKPVTKKTSVKKRITTKKKS